MFDPEVQTLAENVIERLLSARKVMATAESCTGGLLAGAITSIPGSSDILFGGYVTYANAAKTLMIGVPGDLIETHGAVSEPVARAMAEGARRTAGVDLAIAVTGIAGPGGGSEAKPVGLVYLALATATATTHKEMRLGELGRDKVRQETVRLALEMVLEAV